MVLRNVKLGLSMQAALAALLMGTHPQQGAAKATGECSESAECGECYVQPVNPDGWQVVVEGFTCDFETGIRTLQEVFDVDIGHPSEYSEGCLAAEIQCIIWAVYYISGGGHH
jgi:hypothetical protein